MEKFRGVRFANNQEVIDKLKHDAFLKSLDSNERAWLQKTKGMAKSYAKKVTGRNG